MADLRKNTAMFLKEWGRMCSRIECEQCDLYSTELCRCGVSFDGLERNTDKIVDAVQRWRGKIYTYEKDFISKFPNAVYDGGIPAACRDHIYNDVESCDDDCVNCWNMECRNEVENG